jgi:hypothetical protein
MFGKWSKKFDRCQQCGTDRFPHKAKGLCTRCYRLVKMLEQAQKWDVSRPESLKGHPFQSPSDPVRSDSNHFERLRSYYITAIQDRLRLLKAREDKLHGPICGLDLEYMLIDVARLCRVNNERNLFGGMATAIDYKFTEKQVKILYRWLLQIVENTRWSGPDWYSIYMRERK